MDVFALCLAISISIHALRVEGDNPVSFRFPSR